MKKIIVFISLIVFMSCENSKNSKNSEKILMNEGNYTNNIGQSLLINNLTDSSFDFKVYWGENDEWGCLFNEEGKAIIFSDSMAYFGEDPEWADIEFNFKKDTIKINGGLEYIGMDCAKYGNTWTEDFTIFTFGEKKGTANYRSQEIPSHIKLSKKNEDSHCLLKDVYSENGLIFLDVDFVVLETYVTESYEYGREEGTNIVNNNPKIRTYILDPNNKSLPTQNEIKDHLRNYTESLFFISSEDGYVLDLFEASLPG